MQATFRFRIYILTHVMSDKTDSCKNIWGRCKMDIISKLKEAKKKKRMTAEDISSLTSIPVSTLNKIFSGVIDEPKFSTVVSIASALDCPLDSLAGTDPIHALEGEEKELLLSFRTLDSHGRELCSLIVKKEAERVAASKQDTPTAQPAKEAVATVLPFTIPKKSSSGKLTLRLLDLPASAGCGEFLDASGSSSITVAENPTTASADFAIKVNGNSMEPEYYTGDIILIREQSEVLPGELGLFVCDGEGYFKKFGGDRLISLNSQYSDIMIKSFSDFSCKGKVIGKLRRKK